MKIISTATSQCRLASRLRKPSRWIRAVPPTRSPSICRPAPPRWDPPATWCRLQRLEAGMADIEGAVQVNVDHRAPAIWGHRLDQRHTPRPEVRAGKCGASAGRMRRPRGCWTLWAFLLRPTCKAVRSGRVSNPPFPSDGQSISASRDTWMNSRCWISFRAAATRSQPPPPATAASPRQCPGARRQSRQRCRTRNPFRR